MARVRDRVFALTIAILFFLFASALSIFVIYQAATTHTNQSAASKPTNVATTLEGTQLSNFTPTSSVPSLQTTDTTVGTGATAKANDTVTVDYTGAVASTGVIFQSTKDTGQSVALTLNTGPSGVIAGFANGVPGMKVGGTRRILIPADQAYGANPPAGSSIPANAALVFDITLDKIGS